MTNITKKHKDVFEALTSGDYSNFCLFSCFVNDKPAAAICSVHKLNNGEVEIIPHFVSPTDELTITDHEGVQA